MIHPERNVKIVKIWITLQCFVLICDQAGLEDVKLNGYPINSEGRVRFLWQQFPCFAPRCFEIQPACKVTPARIYKEVNACWNKRRLLPCFRHVDNIYDCNFNYFVNCWCLRVNRLVKSKTLNLIFRFSVPRPGLTVSPTEHPPPKGTDGRWWSRNERKER